MNNRNQHGIIEFLCSRFTKIVISYAKRKIDIQRPPAGYYYPGSNIRNYVPNKQYEYGIIYPFLSSMSEMDGIRYVPVSPSERTCDAIDCINDERNVNVKILSEVSYKGITMKVQKVQPYICYNNKYIEKLEYEFDNIPIKAFESCNNLKEVKLGNNILSIADNAFAYCSNLTKVTFGNNISSIGKNSFSGCSSWCNI